MILFSVRSTTWTSSSNSRLYWARLIIGQREITSIVSV
uniref:Uncharacterized protein n=1 Tax=Ascaris lumbricoides TaxID=6252 RepID=A0A0M3HII5_ASCLU